MINRATNRQNFLYFDTDQKSLQTHNVHNLHISHSNAVTVPVEVRMQNLLSDVFHVHCATARPTNTNPGPSLPTLLSSTDACSQQADVLLSCHKAAYSTCPPVTRQAACIHLLEPGGLICIGKLQRIASREILHCRPSGTAYDLALTEGQHRSLQQNI